MAPQDRDLEQLERGKKGREVNMSAVNVSGREGVDYHYEASKCDRPALRDGEMRPCGIQWFEPVSGPDMRDQENPCPAVRPCPWHRQKAASRSERKDAGGNDPLNTAGTGDH